MLGVLGVRVGLPPAQVETCIREAGICFMSAQTHHAAMRHVAPVRAELGVRTIFNLLGPLANPAGIKYQMLGVYAASWLEPLAQALRNLGSKRVWLVHGADGLDEASTTGPSFITALESGAIRSFEITPEAAGLPRASLSDIKGGNAGRQCGGPAGRVGWREVGLSRHRRAERRRGPHRRRGSGKPPRGRGQGDRGDRRRTRRPYAAKTDRGVQTAPTRAAPELRRGRRGGT